MPQTVRVCDLPASTLENGVFLRCDTCWDQFSATRGDYFWAHPETIMRCPNDHQPLRLVREVRHYVNVPVGR